MVVLEDEKVAVHVEVHERIQVHAVISGQKLQRQGGTRWRIRLWVELVVGLPQAAHDDGALPSGSFWLVAYQRSAASTSGSVGFSDQSQAVSSASPVHAGMRRTLRVPSPHPPVWTRVPSGATYPDEHQVSVKMESARKVLEATSCWVDHVNTKCESIN